MAFYKHTGLFSLPLVLVRKWDSSSIGHSNCSRFLHFRDTPTGTLLRCCLCESLAIRTSETGSHTWEVRLDQSHTSSSLSISLPPVWESSSRIAMWNLPYPQKGLRKRFPLLHVSSDFSLGKLLCCLSCWALASPAMLLSISLSVHNIRWAKWSQGAVSVFVSYIGSQSLDILIQLFF